MTDPGDMQENLQAGVQLQGVAAQFGGYRNEWLGPADVLATFTQPFFFPELETVRPCILEGGRGTGKTTLLKSLSYAAQQSLHGDSWKAQRKYVGVYIKLFTGYVRSFQGPELNALEWQRTFQHYWNLEACRSLLEYGLWFQSTERVDISFPTNSTAEFYESLGLSGGQHLRDMLAIVRKELIRLERYAANIGSPERSIDLSALGRPIDILVDALRSTPAASESCIFLLVDEYEALLPYQQQVINTLIKQSDERASYKIGVRELGLRHHGTLNPTEILTDPADYVLFPISQKLEGRFDDYAAAICNRRLRRIPHGSTVPEIRTLFPALSIEEEAREFGVSDLAAQVLVKISRASSTRTASSLTDLELAFLDYWCKQRQATLDDELEWIRRHPEKWRERMDNYAYAFLFTLRLGKRGIRKHYSGWAVLCGLAAGNTRYMLELVYESILLHLSDAQDLLTPISPRIQTLAAQAIGRKNLKQLEGSSIYGARLARLLLGVGRVLGKLAEQAVGHSPEINQFEISYEDESKPACDLLLSAAVEHLALLRLPGTKLLTSTDVRDWDFTPHPLYAPLFAFSHRRKRKMMLKSSDIVLLSDNPAAGIASILAPYIALRSGQQELVADKDLPDQLSFLSDTYAAADPH